jgi:cytochrome c oxidase subunit 4
MNATKVTPKSYLWVWVALLVLLLLTWGIAEIDLGPFNTVVALSISIVKMALVVLFFMHGRYEKPLTWLFILAGLIWFLIMVDLTLSDYLTRQNSTAQRQFPL